MENIMFKKIRLISNSGFLASSLLNVEAMNNNNNSEKHILREDYEKGNANYKIEKITRVDYINNITFIIDKDLYFYSKYRDYKNSNFKNCKIDEDSLKTSELKDYKYFSELLHFAQNFNFYDFKIKPMPDHVNLINIGGICTDTSKMNLILKNKCIVDEFNKFLKNEINYIKPLFYKIDNLENQDINNDEANIIFAILQKYYVLNKLNNMFLKIEENNDDIYKKKEIISTNIKNDNSHFCNKTNNFFQEYKLINNYNYEKSILDCDSVKIDYKNNKDLLLIENGRFFFFYFNLIYNKINYVNQQTVNDIEYYKNGYFGENNKYYYSDEKYFENIFKIDNFFKNYDLIGLIAVDPTYYSKQFKKNFPWHQYCYYLKGDKIICSSDFLEKAFYTKEPISSNEIYNFYIFERKSANTSDKLTKFFLQQLKYKYEAFKYISSDENIKNIDTYKEALEKLSYISTFYSEKKEQDLSIFFTSVLKTKDFTNIKNFIKFFKLEQEDLNGLKNKTYLQINEIVQKLLREKKIDCNISQTRMHYIGYEFCLFEKFENLESVKNLKLEDYDFAKNGFRNFKIEDNKIINKPYIISISPIDKDKENIYKNFIAENDGDELFIDIDNYYIFNDCMPFFNQFLLKHLKQIKLKNHFIHHGRILSFNNFKNKGNSIEIIYNNVLNNKNIIEIFEQRDKVFLILDIDPEEKFDCNFIINFYEKTNYNKPIFIKQKNNEWTNFYYNIQFKQLNVRKAIKFNSTDFYKNIDINFNNNKDKFTVYLNDN